MTEAAVPTPANNPNIVHETEVQRQHVRLNIPLKVKAGGITLMAEDWSSAGIALNVPSTGAEELHKILNIGQSFKATILYPFGDFDLTLPVELEIRVLSQDKKRVGCRFINVTKQQAAALKYLVNAYLSGELVQAGDILNVVASDNYTKVRNVPEANLSPAEAAKQKRGRSLRVGAIALGALLTFGFVVSSFYERAYVVAAKSASIEATGTVLSATATGNVFFMKAERDSQVKKGQALAAIRTESGNVVSIDSPCDCIVKDRATEHSSRVRSGDKLLQLVPINAKPYITAKLAYEDAIDVATGNKALFRAAGGSKYYSGTVTRIKSEESGGFSTVTIQPKVALPAKWIDDPVEVKFDTGLFSK